MSGGQGKAEYKRPCSGAAAARRRIGLQRSYLVLHLRLLRVALFFRELTTPVSTEWLLMPELLKVPQYTHCHSFTFRAGLRWSRLAPVIILKTRTCLGVFTSEVSVR